MDKYLRINRAAYESTAEEFREKISLRAEATKEVVENFCKLLDERFKHPKVLELGPGSGYVLKLLSEKGYQVKGIEFSEKMAELARSTAPGVEIIVDEFLKHDFKQERFSGIFAMAFIHLFPAPDIVKVLQKICHLLDDRGIVHISTTLHETSEEGYCGKDNFKEQPLRYRKKFTKNELEMLLASLRFKILSQSNRNDHEAPRTWMSFIVENERC